MKIKTLEGVDIQRILNVFNDSFSDYYVPFKLSVEQLSAKMLADKTDLALSVGVFENENLIGFILHGFDIVNNKKLIYNGGTGVIPQKRGQGLTKKMYHFILPILVNKGINKIVLEVIKENTQAINSYKKSGFKIVRELLCYKGKVNPLDTNSEIKVRELQEYNWELMESFGDISPTWQNSKSTLNELKSDNISLGAYNVNQLIAHIIYSPSNNRIQQIAVRTDHRNKRIASTLISELISRHGNALSIINVDSSSTATNAFLNHIGLENNFVQYEMELVINSSELRNASYQ